MSMNAIKGILVAMVLLFAHTVIGSEPVNVNEAAPEELAEKLDGVGDARAEAIVEFREENGPFLSADDLKMVSGIGDATVESNRDRIQVEGEDS